MNGFVIAVGAYVATLTDVALETAKKMGQVSVDMRGTACKVPYAPDYIKNRGMRCDRQETKTVKC
jgi:hypothetical protein